MAVPQTTLPMARCLLLSPNDAPTPSSAWTGLAPRGLQPGSPWWQLGASRVPTRARSWMREPTRWPLSLTYWVRRPKLLRNSCASWCKFLRAPSPPKRGPLATEMKTVSIAGESEWIKGLGLTSATTLVMGSMIGSGIFIVSAEIARLVDSPALLIAAWMVTGFMTITGALAYGELAAMMPHAGGQYVYLRESLGPLWGFLYGWTLFLVIQTGTIAAVGVAFGKFLGVFFPSISSTHWIWHIAHVPALPIGPMVLGNMDIGLNTANLAAVLVITLLTLLNTFGVKLGSSVQNVFTSAKVLALLAVVLVGVVAHNAAAIAANFGAGWVNFWSGAGWHTLHAVPVGVGGPTAFVGLLTVVAVVQVGSLFSSDAWNNVTF